MADAGVDVRSIAVSTNGSADAANNPQALYNTGLLFDIDTKNPTNIGVVTKDGLGTDIDFQSSKTSIAANWKAFSILKAESPVINGP